MKFLTKHSDSTILQEKLVYRNTNPLINKQLKEKLLAEQHHFCAYTEKYIQELDASEVEHFNPALKNNDNYYNYYAVIRNANLYKKDEKYVNAAFFKSLFFQKAGELQKRIKFENGIYIETDKKDQESIDLIDYLGFNHHDLCMQRKRHLNRLAKNFEDAKYSKNQCIEYFKEHREDLSFITAIEVKFQIDLSELLL